MKARCKSVPEIDRVTTDVRTSGNTTYTTQRVTYDMNSVQDHEFDLWVYTHFSHLWTIPFCFFFIFIVLVIPVTVILFVLDQFVKLHFMSPFITWLERGSPERFLIVVGSVLLAFLPVAYGLSNSLIKQHAMERAARKARGLPANAPLKVVEEKSWPAFVAGLK